MIKQSLEEIPRLVNITELSRLFCVTEELGFLSGYLTLKEINECISAGTTNIERLETLVLKLFRFENRQFCDGFANYFLMKSQQFKRMYFSIKYGHVDSIKDISTQTNEEIDGLASNALLDTINLKKEEWTEGSLLKTVISSDSYETGKLSPFSEVAIMKSCNSHYPYSSETQLLPLHNNMHVEVPVISADSNELQFSADDVKRGICKECLGTGEPCPGYIRTEKDVCGYCGCAPTDHVPIVQMDFQVLSLPPVEDRTKHNHSTTMSSEMYSMSTETSTMPTPSIHKKVLFRKIKSKHLTTLTSCNSTSLMEFPPLNDYLHRHLSMSTSPLSAVVKRQLITYLADFYQSKLQPELSNSKRFSLNLKRKLQSLYVTIHIDDIDDILRKLRNVIRQRRFKVKRRRELSESNQPPVYLQRFATPARRSLQQLPQFSEPTMTDTEVADGFEKELKNEYPNREVLKNLIRHNIAAKGNQTYKIWPPYLLSTDLIIYECSLRFIDSQFEGAISKTSQILCRFSDNGSEESGLENLHKILCASKIKDSFMALTLSEDVGKKGPQLVKTLDQFNIAWKGKPLLWEGNTSCAESLVALVGSYHLLDLNYPACHGQLLGFVQEVVLKKEFQQKTFRFIRTINNLADML